MQRNVATPSEYLTAVPDAQRPLLEHLRSLIRDAAPGLREEIRWGMLCYQDSGALFALAAQKKYVALYVMATQALQDMAAQLQDIDHGKGCLRFSRLESVPTETVRALMVYATSLSQRECHTQ